MTVGRRRGREDSKTRSRLIDEALELMSTEGLSALTARRLALRLDLSFQIVHYYFKSMDELLIAVIEHNMVGVLKLLDSAANSSNPLKKLIELHRSPTGVAMGLEFEIYASRRPAIRSNVKRYMERFRQAELDVVASHLQLHELDKALPALAITVVLTSALRIAALEGAVGVKKGHAQTMTWLTSLLNYQTSAKTFSPKTARKVSRSR
jgi:TetR/AcrR family transcriptional regulator